MEYEEAMTEYDLTKEDILAVLDYAAKHLADEEEGQNKKKIVLPAMSAITPQKINHCE